MLRKLLLVASCTAIALGTAPVLAADGNVNFSLGQRSLNESDFGPVDEQPFFGATADFKMHDWPVDLAGGLYRSTKSESISGVDVRATITELSFGVMKTWDFAQNMHPFAGGGLALANVKAEASAAPFGSIEDDDTSTAFYMEGGVYWRLGSMFNLGVQGRYNNSSTVSIGGGDFDSDYFQVGVLAGFGWKN